MTPPVDPTDLLALTGRGAGELLANGEVSQVARLVSPVPGGVGPMTIATLLESTVRLAQARVSN